MNPRLEQQIQVIHIGPNLVWDLSDATEKRPEPDILVEIAETAIRLAERAGADPDDVETLSMLLESVRGKR